jgi:hypothetical protein
LLCLVVGIGSSFFLYRNDSILDEVNPKVVRALKIIRASFISLLSFLLMAPFFLFKDPKVERPIIIFGEDKSQSVELLTDSLSLIKYLSERDEFLNDLEDNYEVHKYQFAENIVSGSTDEFNARSTNISDFLSDMEERYENKNVATLILSSDGNFNRGQNPVYMSSDFPYMLNTIALGDTIPRIDALVSGIKNNKITFLNNTFEVRINIGANLLKGRETDLMVTQGNQVLKSQKVRFDKDEFRKEISLTLKADKVGLQRYEVYLKEFGDEVSKSNNRMYFFIDVLDGQQKVLVLSMAPHPDISTLINSINSNRNFQAEGIKINDFTGEIDEYNMIILYQPKFTNKKIGNVLNSEVPVLTVLGTKTDIRGFNRLKEGITLEQFSGKYNEVSVFINSAFQRFTVSNDAFEDVEKFPPLISPFATYKANTSLSTWFFQRIGKVETDYPLLSFYEQNGKKRGILAGEGLWRWRLSDFQSHGNANLFDEIIQKIVQYMSLKEDKSRFRIDIEASYFENTEIVVGAEYYNEAFDLSTDFPVEFSLEDSSGNSYDYELLAQGKRYQVNLGSLNPGMYKWVANTNDGRKEFIKSGEFSVKPLQLEKNSINANYELLTNLSHRHGGKMYYTENLKEWAEELNSNSKFKPVIHYAEKMKEIISIPWIFLLLVVLISSEWFIRKYHGLI